MEAKEAGGRMTVTLTAGGDILKYRQIMSLESQTAEVDVEWKLLQKLQNLPGVAANNKDQLNGDFRCVWTPYTTVGKKVVIGKDAATVLPLPDVVKLGNPGSLSLFLPGGEMKVDYRSNDWPVCRVRETDLCVSTGRGKVQPGDGCKFTLKFGLAGKPDLSTILDRLPVALTKQLTRSGGMEPTWSPDGNSIMYVSKEGNKPCLWLMDLSKPDQPKKILDNGSQPAWSPDGRTIAFVRTSGTKSVVLVMDPSGGNVRQLTADGAGDTYPAWQDSRTVICETKLGKQLGLSSIQCDNRTRTWLPFDNASFPCIYPNSSSIAYVKSDGKNQKCIWTERLPGPARDKFGSGRRQVTKDGGDLGGAFSPDISINGRLIFASMPMQPQSDIFLLSADEDPEFIPVTSDRLGNETPRWSPDGRAIVFSKLTARGSRELFLIKLADLEP
jgi:hypothetical protein